MGQEGHRKGSGSSVEGWGRGSVNVVGGEGTCGVHVDKKPRALKTSSSVPGKKADRRFVNDRAARKDPLRFATPATASRGRAERMGRGLAEDASHWF